MPARKSRASPSTRAPDPVEWTSPSLIRHGEAQHQGGGASTSSSPCLHELVTDRRRPSISSTRRRPSISSTCRRHSISSTWRWRRLQRHPKTNVGGELQLRARPDAGIYTCNGLMIHTKKSFIGIKGLSEAKVDKICEAAEKLLSGLHDRK